MNKKRKKEKNNILGTQSEFSVKESYKVARTNISFSLFGDGAKKIIVTSPYANEGKTTTCINLAITFGEMNLKVLIIDCDLRKPKIHKILKGKGEGGLSNVLGGFDKLEEVIEQSEYEGVDFVRAGDIPPNPAELLGSERMAEVIEELSEKYDYIFMDTPPINVVTDGVILSSQATGVIIVARHNVTKYKDIQEVIKKLKIVNVRILGTILNDSKHADSRYTTYKEYIGKNTKGKN